MIDLDTARQLIDLGSQLPNRGRADAQLEGAVALHNIMEKESVAYLADEVGMGKTYVALATIALYRHFSPDFRVLFIAPRGNIQTKWQKEWRNFTYHNMKLTDLRVRAADGSPARSMVHCERLTRFVHEVAADDDRDFFLRLTSFSLGMGQSEGLRRYRDELRSAVPWLSDDVFDLRRPRDEAKDTLAQIINAAMPSFDLVVIDEAHALKHGFKKGSASRNRVLAQVLGHPDARVLPELQAHYRPKVSRVLLLSATPLEETYQHLWNQLDVVGRSAGFDTLLDRSAPDGEKKAEASRILIRRVNMLRVNGRDLTKNLYREEWRMGGLTTHDDPIIVTDDRQRLAVALIQKKVSELIGSDKFGDRFQMGMLASFESFQQTARSRPDREDLAASDDVEQVGIFDDATQTDDEAERQGVDVHTVDAIAKDHVRRFRTELPHPKMDAVVRGLGACWATGEKSLVFVRRVASVDELKRKLDEEYDKWLLSRLRRELPRSVQTRLERIIAEYTEDRLARGRRRHQRGRTDTGGADTFFAWFFRGEGPAGVLSGAAVQERLNRPTGALATFFEVHHVANLLGCRPETSLAALAGATGRPAEEVRKLLAAEASHFLTPTTKGQRGGRFHAAQAAAVAMLARSAAPSAAEANALWHQLYEPGRHTTAVSEFDAAGALSTTTFFSELLQRPGLRELVWPESTASTPTLRVRERHLRAQLIATTSRLGHSLIDLYVTIVAQRGSITGGTSARLGGESAGSELISAYVSLLEHQSQSSTRELNAFRELSEIAGNFDEIVRMNLPDLRSSSDRLASIPSYLASVLGQQQPVAGMSGTVSKTSVAQFRMPGYPLVLITTDVLQEGEDLHLFCRNVVHYGVSWTPSSMEQRNGRIDRVGSMTDRRLSALDRDIEHGDRLQVYLPYLQDTVEVLQVRKVLRRMFDFTRLMHEGIDVGARDKHVDTSREILASLESIPQLDTPLTSSFPIRPEHLRGERRPLLVQPGDAAVWLSRLRQIRDGAWPTRKVEWSDLDDDQMALYGTIWIDGRQQPFALRLDSLGGQLLAHCVSPVGQASPQTRWDELSALASSTQCRLVATPGVGDRTYDLSIEDDVPLGAPETDLRRVSAMVARVTWHADEVEWALLQTDKALEEFRSTLATDARHAR